ncbi:hypothetical protein ABVT39_007086 [Epinephelus coioides]
MDEPPKRKEGAEKLWEKRRKNLRADAAKCVQISAMFAVRSGAAGPSAPTTVHPVAPNINVDLQESSGDEVAADGDDSEEEEEEGQKDMAQGQIEE